MQVEFTVTPVADSLIEYERRRVATNDLPKLADSPNAIQITFVEQVIHAYRTFKLYHSRDIQTCFIQFVDAFNIFLANQLRNECIALALLSALSIEGLA